MHDRRPHGVASVRSEEHFHALGARGQSREYGRDGGGRKGLTPCRLPRLIGEREGGGGSGTPSARGGTPPFQPLVFGHLPIQICLLPWVQEAHPPRALKFAPGVKQSWGGGPSAPPLVDLIPSKWRSRNSSLAPPPPPTQPTNSMATPLRTLNLVIITL